MSIAIQILIFIIRHRRIRIRNLKGLNLNKYRPKFMLIEIYNKDYNEIINFLNILNYKLHSNFTNYNKIDNPTWDGTHNDYLFVDNLL